MSTLFRANRKAEDADIIRLNSVGLSLSTIARVLDCHPSTVTLRLNSLGVPPADTRRSFMEDIFVSLSVEQQERLADQLVNGMTVKEFVKSLIIKAYQNR